MSDALPPYRVSADLLCASKLNPPDFLLFTDADTVHHETSVESAVVMAVEKQTQLLSVWPHQVTVTWAEKLIIPMSYLLGLAFVPYWFLRIAQRSHKSFRWVPRAMWRRMGAANGQYMLVYTGCLQGAW
ncbi:hypothetical protein OAN94_07040 [Verrucomicrobiales bacterium]|nr:hypothetical protein [Verrucomicrobiales bacterium]